MLPINDIKAFDKAREEINKKWEEHKKSSECTGTNCSICKAYEKEKEQTQPLN